MADHSLSLFSLAVLAGCAGGAPPEAAAPAPALLAEPVDARGFGDAEPMPAIQVDALPDAGWQVRRFVGQRFSLRLPDAARWQLEEDSRWLALRHEPSRSRLRVRVWSSGLRANKNECLEQVYLWQGALRPQSDAIVERRLAAPQGYDVGLRIDLLDESPKRAVALVYGASVRRCYAAIFETSVQGDDDAMLGGRLRLVVDGVLDRIQILDVEQRAQGD